MNLLKYFVISITILVVFGVIISGWKHYNEETEIPVSQSLPVTYEEPLISEADPNQNTETEAVPQSANELSDEVLVTVYEPEPVSIEATNVSEFETADDIMLYINKLNDLSSDPDMKVEIKERQLADYPVMRKKWVDVMLKDAMEANGIKVSVGGKRNTVLTFTGGANSSMDKELVHEIYEDVFRKLRFKKADYNWGRYKSVAVSSLDDGDLMD